MANGAKQRLWTISCQDCEAKALQDCVAGTMQLGLAFFGHASRMVAQDVQDKNNVVNLASENNDPNDVKKKAQQFADDLIAGKYGDLRSITMVMEDKHGSVKVFGWGETGLLRSIGMLHLGQAHLTEMRLFGPDGR